MAGRFLDSGGADLPENPNLSLSEPSHARQPQQVWLSNKTISKLAALKRR